MNLAELDKKAKPGKASNQAHRITASKDAETGDLILRIPQLIPADCVHASKTEKAVPMVTLVPAWADGTPGSVAMEIVVVAKEMVAVEGGEPQEREVEKVYHLRIGAFNGFVTA